MDVLDRYKPVMAMIAAQVLAAGTTLVSDVAISQGLSPEILSVYRLIIGTVVIAPMAYFSRRRASSRIFLGPKEFLLLYIAALLGPTINSIGFFEGISMSSSTMSSVIANLSPALTFVFAAAVRIEKVNFHSLRSIGKIIGTVMCVSGAMVMVLLKGPKLLNQEVLELKSLCRFGDKTWLLGSLILFGNNCCLAIWSIMQVPISAKCPDPLLATAWMYFFGFLQTIGITIFMERNPEAWIPHSSLEDACLLSVGIASAAILLLQTWCIPKRGPVFSAMFSPLGTIMVTILAVIFLHDIIYTGSLLGAIVVIAGLYTVLWGQAGDLDEIKQGNDFMPQADQESIQQGSVNQSSGYVSNINLKDPLLYDNC